MNRVYSFLDLAPLGVVEGRDKYLGEFLPVVSHLLFESFLSGREWVWRRCVHNFSLLLGYFRLVTITINSEAGLLI